MTKLHQTRPRLVCLVAGLVCGLAFAPFFIWPLLLAAFGLLAATVARAATLKKAFSLSWLFGLGYFVGGLWWMCWPFSFLGAWWAIAAAPFAILGLCAVLAVFIAIFGVMWWLSLKYTPAFVHPVTFGLLWVAFEGVRAVFWYGFPWNLAGYSLAGSPWTMQAAAFGGVWLLSFALACGGAALAKPSKGYIGFVILLGTLGAGAVRFYMAPPVEELPLTAQLVQGNIPQELKWVANHRQKQLATYTGLSRAEEANLILWPETAAPFLPGQNPALDSVLEGMGAQSALITGQPRANYITREVFNSVLAYTRHGLQAYDKQLLVPFGEFMPYRQYIPSWVGRFVAGGQDYSPGEVYMPLHAAGLKIAPFICYEAIFPGYVSRHSAGADVLANVTNDAWFGPTPGPAQHFAMARMRAVETGIPLLRAANTGITAVVDGYGQIRGRLQVNESASLFIKVPKKSAPTPFQEWISSLYRLN